jgi:hypothetical protein
MKQNWKYVWCSGTLHCTHACFAFDLCHKTLMVFSIISYQKATIFCKRKTSFKLVVGQYLRHFVITMHIWVSDSRLSTFWNWQLEHCVLLCDALQSSREVPTYHRNLLSAFSWYKRIRFFRNVGTSKEKISVTSLSTAILILCLSI